VALVPAACVLTAARTVREIITIACRETAI